MKHNNYDCQEQLEQFDNVFTVEGYYVGIVWHRGRFNCCIDYIAILSDTVAPDMWTDTDCPFIVWHCNPDIDENTIDVLTEVWDRCENADFSYTGPRYGN